MGAGQMKGVGGRIMTVYTAHTDPRLALILVLTLLNTATAPGESVHRGAQDRVGGRGWQGQTTGDQTTNCIDSSKVIAY